MNRTHEAAFETVIEDHLLQNGYLRVDREGFDRERAIFPDSALAFVRETQPREWAKLEALLCERTGDQIIGDLCKWMDANGAIATLIWMGLSTCRVALVLLGPSRAAFQRSGAHG